MPTGMLGRLRLDEIRGPRDALEIHLAGDNGRQWLDQLNNFLQKKPVWEDKRHLAINCQDLPKQRDFGTLVEHRPGGMWRWDHSRVALFQLPAQQDTENLPTVRELYEAVQPLRPANACVLEYLFSYDQLIPSEWGEKQICFMGTLFANEKVDGANSPGARVRGMKWVRKESGSDDWQWWGKVSFLDAVAGPNLYAMVITGD